MRTILTVIGLCALAVSFGGQALERKIVKRDSWPNKGAFLPMAFPALHTSGLCLDDLKTADLIAIVEPIGRPVLEIRTGHLRNPPSTVDLMVVVQSFRVVDAIGSGATEVGVVIPVPKVGNRPFENCKPLLLEKRYLLIAGKQERNMLSISEFLSIARNHERPKDWEVYKVPALDITEFAGWSLVRTDATRLPKAASREENALLAIGDATSVIDVAPEHDAAFLLARTHWYSVRTRGPWSSSEKQQESAKGDFIGTTQAEKYFAENLSEYILSKMPSSPGPRHKALLETLSKWGSGEAKRRYEARPPQFAHQNPTLHGNSQLDY